MESRNPFAVPDLAAILLLRLKAHAAQFNQRPSA